jgi:hypothetical protein
MEAVQLECDVIFHHTFPQTSIELLILPLIHGGYQSLQDEGVISSVYVSDKLNALESVYNFYAKMYQISEKLFIMNFSSLYGESF